MLRYENIMRFNMDESESICRDEQGGNHCGRETGKQKVHQAPLRAASTSSPASLASATVVDQSDMALQWSQTAATIATCQSW